MQKPLTFWSPERISRLVLTFLLMVGILLPILMLFGLGRQVWMGLLYAALTLGVFTLGTGKRWRWLALVLAGGWAAVQFFLPGLGFWGGCVETLKAIALYFNGIPVAMTLFGGQVTAVLAISVTAVSFLFTKKGVGFLPAAIMVVLTLFGLWSLGKAELVWFSLPALVAMLLLMSRAAHEKISVLNVLPMAVAVVLLSLLLLPAGRLTIPPLEQAAFSLRQTIIDYLFFTEPRNVFTLGSYGYYPMGGNQLGGEAEPSDYPVMMVKTSGKTLLRAVVKDEYTGRSFRDTSSARRYLYVSPRWAGLRAKVFLESMPAEAIRKASTLLDERAISVQMQNTAASTVFTPVFLRNQSVTGNMVPYFNDASELFITRDLAEGDKYTVFAPTFEGGAGGLDALINACLKNDENYAEMQARYSQLPEHMEQKVYQDVAAMTANANTPYEKAMAIMRHLQKYYRYTLAPDEPPENLDFVTYFLYVGKEGYCTYYASAMTVLCRMAGLPARYVEGFLAQPAMDGFAYVTGKDAHAWTEVYFEGFGWVPFDPTPLQQGEEPPPPPPENDPPPPDQPTPTPEPPQDDPQNTPPPPPPDQQDEPQKDENDPSDDAPDPPQNHWWWIALLVAAAGVALRMRIQARSPGRLASKATSEKDKIFIYGNAVNTLLKLRGRTPKQGETPLLFARRMDNVHFLPEPILPLWRMMALSNYSRRQPTQEQTQKAKDTFTKVYKKQRWFTRLRFQLTAAFGKRCYTGLDTVVEHVEPVSNTRLPSKEPAKGKKRKKGKAGPKSNKPPARPGQAPEGAKRAPNSKPAQGGKPAGARKPRAGQKRK